jgi:hypothetical protein
VNAELLVVSRSRDAKVNCSLRRDILERQEIAAPELGAVGGEGIDFVFGIDATIDPVGSPTRAAPNHDDVPMAAGPFALLR